MPTTRSIPTTCERSITRTTCRRRHHAAIKQHPDWAARKPDGEPYGEATSVFGPYVDALMIPMFKELPEKRSDKHFERFRQFQRDGFKSYLAHYVNAMHDYAPDFEIASNWAYTAHMPEPVDVDVDFISGDVTPQDALAEVLMDAPAHRCASYAYVQECVKG